MQVLENFSNVNEVLSSLAANLLESELSDWFK